MKSIKHTLVLVVVFLSYSLVAQNKTNNTQKNEGKSRFITYFSKGKIAMNINSDGKMTSDDSLVDKNITLIRRLLYTAKEANTKDVHSYTLLDGKLKQLADRKPDYCQVTNTVNGEITDEFSNTKTCDIHYGEGPFRNVIDGLVSFYAKKFKSDIDQFKGVFYIKPSAGTKSIHFKSPKQLTVTLVAEGREYKAIANLVEINGQRKVLRTHTFIVTDISKDNPEKGKRRIIIKNDYKSDTQKIIKDLVKYAQNKTQIWNGKRRKFITNKSDITSQF